MHPANEFESNLSSGRVTLTYDVLREITSIRESEAGAPHRLPSAVDCALIHCTHLYAALYLDANAFVASTRMHSPHAIINRLKCVGTVKMIQSLILNV
jgi:hypothetical protein